MKNNKKKIIALLFVLMVSFGSLLANEIKIGVSIRMVSDVGFKIGEMIKSEFASINEAGGVHGKSIELIFLNDECKSEKGVANATKLAYEHKVHLIIGSSCSSVTLPMVDVATKAKVPQITPHSTNPTITQKNSAWIFRVPVSGRYYNGVQAEYVAQKLGKRVAYIYASDAAGQAFAKDMIKYLKDEYGADPVFEAQVQEREIDFRPALLKAKKTKPDVLVIAALQDESARALVQSYEVGIPKSISRVLPSVASKQEVPQLAGDAVIGVFYAAAYSAADTRPIAKLFNEKIQKEYGVLPDHDFSQAWDLVQIVRIALEEANITAKATNLASDRTALRDAIANVKNYRGLAYGPIGFCAAPTPECRDGNRTPVLIEYVKGGKNFETRILDTITFEDDFGL
jgi:ABC-type branched-subunit amino acid transport system substrate-binding protein